MLQRSTGLEDPDSPIAELELEPVEEETRHRELAAKHLHAPAPGFNPAPFDSRVSQERIKTHTFICEVFLNFFALQVPSGLKRALSQIWREPPPPLEMAEPKTDKKKKKKESKKSKKDASQKKEKEEKTKKTKSAGEVEVGAGSSSSAAGAFLSCSRWSHSSLLLSCSGDKLIP